VQKDNFTFTLPSVSNLFFNRTVGKKSRRLAGRLNLIASLKNLGRLNVTLPILDSSSGENYLKKIPKVF
jgi:hypothetical protein